MKKRIVFVLICLGFVLPGASLENRFGNKFIFSQLKYDGAWDPYPEVHRPILATIQQMTNITFEPERFVVALDSEDLFQVSFIIIKGNSKFSLSSKEKKNLKEFIERGGFVFFDDTLATKGSRFSVAVRDLMEELYPDRGFKKLSMDHAIFRSFFLLRKVAGRRRAASHLEGLDIGGGLGGEKRTAVIYCANDLLGAWMKDHLGNYLFSCEPGGETQRWESFKLTVNLIYFSLTGTYKRDAVHQPFIEKKLGR